MAPLPVQRWSLWCGPLLFPFTASVGSWAPRLLGTCLLGLEGRKSGFTSPSVYSHHCRKIYCVSGETLLVMWHCEQPRASNEETEWKICQWSQGNSYPLPYKAKSKSSPGKSHKKYMHFRENFRDNHSQSLLSSVDFRGIRGIKIFN